MSIGDRDWERERDKKNFERMIANDESATFRSNHPRASKATDFVIIFLIITIAFSFIAVFYL
jgi:hypothetical protein